MCDICNNIFNICDVICNGIKEYIKYIYVEHLYLYSFIDDHNYGHNEFIGDNYIYEDEEYLNRNEYKMYEEMKEIKEIKEIELKTFSNDRFNKDNIIILVDNDRDIRLRKFNKEENDEDEFIIINLPETKNKM